MNLEIYVPVSLSDNVIFRVNFYFQIIVDAKTEEANKKKLLCFNVGVSFPSVCPIPPCHHHFYFPLTLFVNLSIVLICQYDFVLTFHGPKSKRYDLFPCNKNIYTQSQQRKECKYVHTPFFSKAVLCVKKHKIGRNDHLELLIDVCQNN